MLHVTTSNRSEALIAPLAASLRDSTVGPLGEETVVVGADGVKRWLTKQLAQELGVCAQVRFVYTGSLIKDVMQKLVGAPAADADVWCPDSLQWAVLAALPDLLDRAAFAPLRAYLTGRDGPDEPELGGIKAFGLARRIAGVFSRYLTFRPDMLLAWDQGDETGAGGEAWQPVLWRALHSVLETDHPATWTRRFFKAINEQGFQLPDELKTVRLFGISSLPHAHVRVLAALARHADVQLFVVTPSRQDWAQVQARRAEWRALETRDDGGLDHFDPSFEADHPLLTSLAGLGRDFQVLLERESDYDETEAFDAPAGETLLGRLQADVFSLTPRGTHDALPHPLDPADSSLSFHACHGDMRQVEVLQDQLLALFEQHEDLEPSDVLVLTPDVETFAPLVDAVFHGQGGGAPRLRVRVANRAERSQNPAAEALLRVLSLVGRRLTATSVIDLLGLEPIRLRFEFDSDGVARAVEWVREAQIRWAVDADDRVRKGQPAFELNTWEWGLERLLLGYALPGHGRDLFGGRLPYDQVEGSDSVVLGQLVEFCEVLFGHLRALEEQTRTLSGWGEALRTLAGDLLQVADEDAPQLEGVYAALDGLESNALAAKFEGLVDHEVPRAVLVDHFDQSRAATSFLTGSITVCGMVPLRSIGHKVVCLLGLDDGAFPRTTSGSGFDLLGRRPALGDRNPRDDDRYLFLEAILSARSHVRVFYSGQSVRNNKPLPPSVVISELLDYLAQAYRLPAEEGETDEQARARLVEHLVVRHPLQPFSPRYFGAGDDDRLFSYAQGYVQGARALASAQAQPPSFWDAPLDPVQGDEASTVTLWELERFFQLPVAALLRSRLGLSYPRDEDQADDREPLDLGNLAAYQVGAGLLDQALSSVPAEQAGQAALQSGCLPPGTPGVCALAEVGQQVAGVAERVLSLRGGGQAEDALEPVEIDLDWGELRLVGQVPGLWPGGQVVHHFASLKARYTLGLWIRHLALHASGPDVSVRSVLVTRVKKAAPFCAVQGFQPMEQEPARELLGDLLDLYQEGQRRPLLFFPATSHDYAKAYLKALARKTDAEARWAGLPAAGKAWRGNSFMKIAGDRDDAFVARVFGEEEPFVAGFALAGLEIGEGFAFHDLALRVFEPLLDALEEGIA